MGWLISNGTDCPHPLGSVTLSSRREFLDAQATQPNLPVSFLFLFFSFFLEGREAEEEEMWKGWLSGKRERESESFFTDFFSIKKSSSSKTYGTIAPTSSRAGSSTFNLNKSKELPFLVS